MNIHSRYEDIAEKSGLSEEIVRRVLKASRESLAETLKHGERATLPGICIFTPEIKYRATIENGTMTNTGFIHLKAKPSNSMETELKGIENFIIDNDNEEDNGIALKIIGKDTEEKIFPINALL